MDVKTISRTSTVALAVLTFGAARAIEAAPGPFDPAAISEVAERVTPAVVSITTRRARANSGPGFEDHPVFREFFGQGRRAPPEMGAGSGVVISPDGDIVTNNHVIEGADEVIVLLPDQREFHAKIVGADKASDVAFLKIDAKDLPYLRFGDSSKLRLGQWVLAVGNPFGVGQTVTMGIVSAQGRASVGIVDYEDFIQTDASINPGNSGGALVSLEGELVGINTAILSRSGGAQGIGFAVPSNMIQPIRRQIAEHGRVRRGWLGVAIQDLTPDIARSLMLEDTRGVLVSDVMEGGPAQKAKLEAGDVIVQVDDEPTKTAAQLRNHIALVLPGSRTKLTVLRGGKPRSIDVLLDEKRDEASVAHQTKAEEKILSGLGLRDLDAELRARLRVPTRVEGVVVHEVEPGSPADRAGLEEGDVITQVNRVQVRSVSQVERMISETASDALLRVFKRGIFTFVVLRK